MTNDLTKPHRPIILVVQSKFTAPIAQAHFPEKLKTPSTVGKYDGTSDPDGHVNVFVGAAGVERWTELLSMQRGSGLTAFQ
jgi:hypothetical protein